MIRRLLLLLLFASSAFSATVIRYVDPDASGGGTGVDWTNAYTSLSAWDTAEGTNLVTDGDIHQVYCRSSAGTDDTTAFLLSGWTTGASNYIEIIGDDFPSDGVWDESAYILHNNDTDGQIIQIVESFVRIKNLQIRATGTTGTKSAVYIASVAAPSEIRIDSCLINGVMSGTGAANGIYSNDSDVTVNIYNTIVDGFVSGTDSGFVGILIGNGTVNIYNSTVYGNRYGIRQTTGTVTATNCISGNNNDDFSGTITVTYCCSDDGDGTNAQTPSGSDWANEFTTPGSNFSLLVGGNCVGNGTDNPGSGLYSDDIIGTTRSSTWDIGAYEYEAGASTGAAITGEGHSSTITSGAIAR